MGGVMGGWKGTGVVGADALAEARVHAHYAVQWLARVARNFLAKEDDDSHTALTWDSEHQALFTQPIEGGKGEFRFGLRIADLSLVILASRDITPIPLKGHNERQFEAWIRASLLEQNVDRGLALNLRPPPYEMPDHPIAKGGIYGEGVSDDALGELAAWYEGAAKLLADGPANEKGASAIRVWPHHFDIAVLVSLDSERSVGAGLAPGDKHYGAPYLYVTTWPTVDAGGLPDLSTGHWHSDEFTAAILEANDIIGGADTGAFLSEAIGACRKALG